MLTNRQIGYIIDTIIFYIGKDGKKSENKRFQRVDGRCESTRVSEYSSSPSLRENGEKRQVDSDGIPPLQGKSL